MRYQIFNSIQSECICMVKLMARLGKTLPVSLGKKTEICKSNVCHKSSSQRLTICVLTCECTCDLFFIDSLETTLLLATHFSKQDIVDTILHEIYTSLAEDSDSGSRKPGSFVDSAIY